MRFSKVLHNPTELYNVLSTVYATKVNRRGKWMRDENTVKRILDWNCLSCQAVTRKGTSLERYIWTIQFGLRFPYFSKSMIPLLQRVKKRKRKLYYRLSDCKHIITSITDLFYQCRDFGVCPSVRHICTCKAWTLARARALYIIGLFRLDCEWQANRERTRQRRVFLWRMHL